MYYAYVIQSLKTKEFYKGIAEDINIRINQHINGRSTFSKDKLPLRLIHVEICTDRSEARRMEKFFKSGFGREIIKEIAELT